MSVERMTQTDAAEAEASSAAMILESGCWETRERSTGEANGPNPA